MLAEKKISLNNWKNRNFIVFWNKSYYKFEVDSNDDSCNLIFDSNSLEAKSILDLDICKYKNYGLVSLSKDNSQLIDWNSLCIFGDKKFLKKYVWWFLPPVFIFGWVIVIFKYKKIKNRICGEFFSVHNELVLDKYKFQEDLGGEEEILEAKKLFLENKSFKQISDKLDDYDEYSELIEQLDNPQYQKILDLKKEYSNFYEIDKKLRDPRLKLSVQENQLDLLERIYQDNNNDVYQIQTKIWGYDNVSNDLIQLKNSLGGEEEILEAKRLFALNNSFRHVSELLSDPRLNFEIKDSSQLAVLSDLYERNNKNVLNIQNKIGDYDNVFEELSKLKEDLGGIEGIFKIQKLFNEYKGIDEINRKLEDPRLELSIKNEHLDAMSSIYRENNEDPIRIQKRIEDYNSVKSELDSLKSELGDDMGILEVKKLLEKNENFKNISDKLDNYVGYAELIEQLDNPQYQKILDLKKEYSDFYEIDKKLRDPRLKLSVQENQLDLLERIYQDNNNDVYQIQNKIQDSHKWSKLIEDLGGEEEIHAIKSLIRKYGSSNKINQLLSNPKLHLDIDDNHLSDLVDIYKDYDGDLFKVKSELRFVRSLMDVNNYGCSNEDEVKNKLQNSLSSDQQNILTEYGKMNGLPNDVDVSSVCSYIQKEIYEESIRNEEKFGTDKDKTIMGKNYERYVCDLIEEIYSNFPNCSVRKQYYLDGLQAASGKGGKIDCLIESNDSNSPISMKIVVEVKYSDANEKNIDIDKWGMKKWNEQLKNYSQQIKSHINLIVTNRYVSRTNFWKCNEKDIDGKLFFIIHDSILIPFLLSMSLIFNFCHSTSLMVAEKQSMIQNSSDSDMTVNIAKSTLEVLQIHGESDEKIRRILFETSRKIERLLQKKEKKLSDVNTNDIKSKLGYYADPKRDILELEGSQSVEIIEELDEEKKD